jgi:hypothetical protein
MALRRTKAVEWFWRLHIPVYRVSGGRILGLDTVGRKSGQRGTNALSYRPEGGEFVMISPETTIQALGAEREELCSALVAQAPEYDAYRAERRIPAPVLERRPAGG